MDEWDKKIEKGKGICERGLTLCIAKCAMIFDEIKVKVDVDVEVTWVVVRPVCSASSRFSLGEG